MKQCNFTGTFSREVWVCFLASAFIFMTGCQPSKTTLFQSQWDVQGDSVWAGPQYWANPMQDWRTANGRLECVVSGADRNVNLLTYQLTPQSAMTMQVTAGKLSEDVNGWVGFRFAIAGKFNEYRHNCIFGKGIDAGITTDGQLFIGDTKQQGTFDGQVVLRLELSKNDGKHLAVLTATDAAGKETLVSTTFDSEKIAGNVALVANAGEHVQVGKVRRKPSFYFENWQVSGDGLAGGADQNFGPILWAQHTLGRDVMKMSVQFPPIGEDDSKTTSLEIQKGGKWQRIATADIEALSRVAAFRVADWDSSKDTKYRVVYNWLGEDVTYEGTVQHDPVEKDEIVVAGFTGNKDYGFPNLEIVDNVSKIDPDVLFFSGDQIYESVAGYGIIRNPLDLAALDYLRKWYLFGWSFGDLLKDTASVILPDDHDVYQGNVWGQGGRKAKRFGDGGYVMDPKWVNMIQRTQTSHMPDAYDPTLLEQDIEVYYTDWVYGRVGFAILEDRKFKSGPTAFRQSKTDDFSKAVLLGQRQLSFLDHWVEDWRQCDLKAVLSQTVFSQCHTHGNANNTLIKADYDSNGWPPQKRDAALRRIRKAFAFMYAGDNHLPTVVHHGIDDWEDAGISFTVPSISAGFPRAWHPGKAGLKKGHGLPGYAKQLPGFSSNAMPDYLGRYISTWGHHLTFLAAANPGVMKGHHGTPPGDIELLDIKSSGFGIVRFHKPAQKITIECYRILASLDQPDKAQFADWPITIDMRDNYKRKPYGYLKEVSSELKDPVVKLYDEKDGELVYALRIRGKVFRPWVFADGTYTVTIGCPDKDQWITIKGLKVNKLKMEKK